MISYFRSCTRMLKSLRTIKYSKITTYSSLQIDLNGRDIGMKYTTVYICLFNVFCLFNEGLKLPLTDVNFGMHFLKYKYTILIHTYISLFLVTFVDTLVYR